MIISGRFCYVNIMEPREDLSGNLKYSIQVLISKGDAQQIAAINAEIDRAAELGAARGKYKAPLIASPKFRRPLRDGDAFFAENPCDARDCCQGHYFINAANTRAPGVVDAHGRPMMDLGQIYSGCYGLVDVSFFPFAASGNVGIGASLQNVMKKSDGERFDGRLAPEQAFAKYIEPQGASTAQGDGIIGSEYDMPF